MEEEKMSSNTTARLHKSQFYSSLSLSDPLVTSVSVESTYKTCSQDKIVASLRKEIEEKNSRIEELQQRFDETVRSLSKSVMSLVREIELQNERMILLEQERKKKNAECESASRVVVSLSREVDCKNEQILHLKHTCSEMYSDIRELMDRRDYLHKLCIQGDRKMRSITLRNKMLNSNLQSVKKKPVQLVQGVDGPQSDGGKSCAMEVVGSGNTDIGALIKELEEKTEEVSYLQNLNQTLILKERASNNELLDAQQELLSGLHAVLSNRTMLGIKRMGALNTKPFLDACIEKFPTEEREIKCAKVCSLWEDHVKDSNWHPFKLSSIDGNLQTVIDESDEKLQDLRKEWGEEAYKAVSNALLELKEYNPSGRYPVPKIWNFKEERISSLKEVIGYLIHQVKTRKRKRVYR